MLVRVVNNRDSLDAVPIVPFYVPFGDPLKEHMVWCAMALVSKAEGRELCIMEVEVIDVAGKG